MIQLSEAITKEELLAGKIRPAFDVNDRKVAGQFVVYPSDNEIYIEVSGSLVYRLTNIEFPTNTLRLERTREFPESGTMFIEVEFATFAVVDPVLPVYNNASLTVTFPEPLTMQDFLSKVKLYGVENGSFGECVAQQSGGASVTVKSAGGSGFMYTIDFSGGASETLQMVSSGSISNDKYLMYVRYDA